MDGGAKNLPSRARGPAAIKLGRRMVHFKAGILDDVPSQEPSFHVFTGSNAPWHTITDNLQQYDELPQSRKREWYGTGRP
jgi:hypothetical protein